MQQGFRQDGSNQFLSGDISDYDKQYDGEDKRQTVDLQTED